VQFAVVATVFSSRPLLLPDMLLEEALDSLIEEDIPGLSAAG
jgi:hypothetical protein